jgi:hypothetical protein
VPLNVSDYSYCKGKQDAAVGIFYSLLRTRFGRRSEPFNFVKLWHRISAAPDPTTKLHHVVPFDFALHQAADEVNVNSMFIP